MKGFHSTVSRRDFMKGVGLAGAGIGAAGLVAPAFHDLDDIVAAKDSMPKRPWWVKKVDSMTTEVDFPIMQRFAEGETMRGSRLKRFEEARLTRPAEVDEYTRLQEAAPEQRKQGILNNIAGLTLRDQAIGTAAQGGITSVTGYRGTFLNQSKAATPESRGVPKWSGTDAEENLRMITNVMRGFGAMAVGSCELKPETTQKFIYSQEPSFKQFIHFRDVDAPSETTTEHIIPNSYRWAVTYVVQESIQVRLMEGHSQGFAPISRYMRAPMIQAGTQEFLRAIGYDALGTDGNSLGIGPAFTTFTGITEMSRLNRGFTPEWGPAVGAWMMVTNLPLPDTSPIDAGMLRFCATCLKCRDACGLLAPNGETDTQWTPEGRYAGLYHTPGKKVYWDDQILCQSWKSIPGACANGRCFGACVFNKVEHGAGIHTVVKTTIANTGLFNGFFRNMDDLMGYGPGPKVDGPNPRAADYWTSPMMINGIDTTVGFD